MKRILILAAMLSILLCAFGTAQAIIGVDDDVPAVNHVVPIICKADSATSSMNTLTAFADVDGAGFGPSGVIFSAYVEIYDYKSRFATDMFWDFTAGDVVSDNCSRIMDEEVAAPDKPNFKMTVGGIDYYVGYLIVYSDPFRLVGWEYLVDLSAGFASGFNPIAIENDFGNSGFDIFDWAEYSFFYDLYVPSPVISYFPRYFVVNNTAADTWNWWILAYPFTDSTRYLSGVICDEEENCRSVAINIPNEINIVNVVPEIPSILKPAAETTWAGYGNLFNCDTYDATTNTCDFACTIDDDPLYCYTSVGWSYERAEGSSLAASWDVMHKMHKTTTWFDVLLF